ncbi:bifunctional acetaldehyde-CoA/alcohol dehydrogenase [Salinispira pacifica]|uniref:Aldehyde-alcohol dehydrogenase n=1 Tax=Salinispira pacifica TaxID=1307761 RepID=V5WDU0_9SPIO|nr:bifunctional acetaldehyde-CoA/alcohol dehydrogenase [Salinispira pacifica]AHC13973.1 Alcohol dehydrogenase/ Acetaldehyde dehydrogenase [Salinispira pacifica]
MDQQELQVTLEKMKQAQREYSGFSQEQVDAVFRHAALKANTQRIELAKHAVAETGMGIVEDKVIKNHFASEFIYNKYKDSVTCGTLEYDESQGIRKVAEALGIICAIIPTTNPTSTAIFKALLALKTRNGVIFSPHPRAAECTIQAARIIRDAAVEAGAPADLISWVDTPSIELSNALMKHDDIALILATGGPGMVKAAYSSGKPAIGVGAGNTPAVMDETADIRMAVNSVIVSKTFDNGVICASEQSVIVHESIYQAVKEEFTRRGAHFCNEKERKLLGDTILDPKRGSINPKIVGQPAAEIARIAGFSVPEESKILIAEVDSISAEEPFAHEKLSPVLAMYSRPDFSSAVDAAKALVELGGLGHTAVLYTDPSMKDRIKEYGNIMPAGRILVNMPSSQGAIGDVYNFRLEPSLTLGCGSWGGNSVSENVGIKHLINIKTVAERRENMLWFRLPPRIYHTPGCLPVALGDLQGKRRAMIVTDSFLFDNGYVETIARSLKSMNIQYQCFHQVAPDPTLETVEKGLEMVNAFQPDVIIGLGGGSPMDAAKIMWLLYEYPEIEFEGLAMRFMDIRKRVYRLPEGNKKAEFVAIPTTSGTGSEVTPFSVITDQRNGAKYPIADYSLTPDMAILDADLAKNMPAGLTAASGIDAITHSLEALVSVMATEYTDAMAIESLQNLFRYLPDAYRDGAANPQAREKVHNASCMAGIAFANAFLGVCHSMAHKLGAAFHLPHGVANALLIEQVVRFNATDNPNKLTAFPKNEYPRARGKYERLAAMLSAADRMDPGAAGKTSKKTPAGKKNTQEGLELLCRKLTELKEELNIPASIQAAGVDEKAFLARVDALAEEAFDDQCTGANPRYPLIKEIKQMYLNAFYGRTDAV